MHHLKRFKQRKRAVEELLFSSRSDSFAKCFALLTFPGSSTQRYAFGTRLTALR